jgi:hypothetical protein
LNRPAEVPWGTFSAIFPEVALMVAHVAGFAVGFTYHLAGVRDVARDRFQRSSCVVVATA